MHILWLKTELLHPVNRGGRIRTYHMLRALRKRHHITYLTLDDGASAPNATEQALEYCHAVDCIPFRTTAKDSARLFLELARNGLSRLPYAIAKYASPEMRRRIGEYAASGKIDLIVCDFLAPSQNLPDGLGIPSLLFQHNVEAEIWRRHASVAPNAVRRAYFRLQWRRMERFEGQECRRFDRVVAVSEADAHTLRDRYGLAECPWIPTGVDTEYFSPDSARPRAPHELVFTGALDWMPNEDGMAFFALEVLPRIRREIPNATIVVVGRNPTHRLKTLAREQPGVRLVGEVPDVRPYMNSASIFVVPLRIGGGTRLKIYEAMAMAIPVVTTAVGAEGLPVAPGTHALFADDPAEFAAAVVRLLRAPDEAHAMAQRAATLVRSRFGWDGVAAQFGTICEQTIQSTRALPATAGVLS
jgi:sugar transferase (PEP-CTERM/EpsH1 system associated)